MTKETIIANRLTNSIVASDDVMVEIFPRYVKCTYDMFNGHNDLTIFERGLVTARSRLSKEALMVVESLKKIGHRGRILEVGIAPKEGLLVLIVEYDGVLTEKQEKQLWDDITLAGGKNRH